MQKTRASLLVIAATALTVATLFLLPFTPKAAVRTAVVERGAFIRSTLLEGVIGYAQEQPLLALQPGRIARVHVQQGQRVSAGELLVSMDTEAQEQELAAVTRMLYEQQEAAAAFGQAGRRRLPPPRARWRDKSARPSSGRRSLPGRFARRRTAWWGRFIPAKASMPAR